jgi:hypothetical protein
MTVRSLTYFFVGLSAVLVAIPVALAAFAG